MEIVEIPDFCGDPEESVYRAVAEMAVSGDIVAIERCFIAVLLTIADYFAGYEKGDITDETFDRRVEIAMRFLKEYKKGR